MHQGAQKAKADSSFPQNGIPRKKDLYPWQKRIPFPISKEYTDRLDKNGIYQPDKNPPLDGKATAGAEIRHMVPLMDGQKGEKTTAEQKLKRA